MAAISLVCLRLEVLVERIRGADLEDIEWGRFRTGATAVAAE
jgi:hypothetical protein